MNIKEGIGYDGKEFTNQNFDTMQMLSSQEKGQLKSELSNEDWQNIHKYLVSRMTGKQQTIVDDLLFENERGLVDTDLPQSKWNHTKELLSGSKYKLIHEQQNRIRETYKYHPIFDYKANYKSNKSWQTDFQLNSFDPYQEYEYLENILDARDIIARMCAEHGLLKYTELTNPDDSYLASKTIDHVRVLGQCKFDNKYFYGYRFTNLFSDTCGAALFPAHVLDSVFINCRFNNMSFFNTQFVDCLFINCTFLNCDFVMVTFESCEFLNTDFNYITTYESGRLVFNHCYMHEYKKRDKQSQPWDDPLQISMSPNCGCNSIDSSFMFTECVGVPTNASFLNMLERDSKGFICYKRIGSTTYPQPDRWVIKNGSFLTENMNNNRLIECERGVNVSNFFFAFTQYMYSDLWVCRIRYEDAGDICVPWGSSGKFRATRVELLHEITRWETQIKIVEREVAKWNKARLTPKLTNEIEDRYEYVCKEYILKPEFNGKSLSWWFDELVV